jgi:hypothetical protein
MRGSQTLSHQWECACAALTADQAHCAPNCHVEVGTQSVAPRRGHAVVKLGNAECSTDDDCGFAERCGADECTCFPADAQVQLESGRRVAISSLKVRVCLL